MTNDIKTKNSTYNLKNGRYVLGGSTEVSEFALEWWNKVDLKKDPTDLIYIMETKYEGKPHMLGYVFYGDDGLSWIIYQYNSILDPFEELVTGKLLLIPTLERIKKELISPNLKAGGIDSTRIKK